MGYVIKIWHSKHHYDTYEVLSFWNEDRNMWYFWLRNLETGRERLGVFPKRIRKGWTTIVDKQTGKPRRVPKYLPMPVPRFYEPLKAKAIEEGRFSLWEDDDPGISDEDLEDLDG